MHSLILVVDHEWAQGWIIFKCFECKYTKLGQSVVVLSFFVCKAHVSVGVKLGV